MRNLNFRTCSEPEHEHRGVQVLELPGDDGHDGAQDGNHEADEVPGHVEGLEALVDLVVAVDPIAGSDAVAVVVAGVVGRVERVRSEEDWGLKF